MSYGRFYSKAFLKKIRFLVNVEKMRISHIMEIFYVYTFPVQKNVKNDFTLNLFFKGLT